MIGKIEVLGLDELDKQFAKLDDKVKDKALSKAHKSRPKPNAKRCQILCVCCP